MSLVQSAPVTSLQLIGGGGANSTTRRIWDVSGCRFSKVVNWSPCSFFSLPAPALCPHHLDSFPASERK